MCRNRKRHIIIIVISLLLVFLSIYIYRDCNYTIKGIDNYDEYYSAFSLNELGNYNNLYYQCTKTGGYIFTSYGSLIIADYNDVSFLEQISLLNNKDYQEDVVLFDETKYILPNTNFFIGDWNFKVLKNSDTDDCYPRLINFIGFNENENKIAYLTFRDQDLDYLCKIEDNDYMPKFINKYFNYKFDKK